MQAIKFKYQSQNGIIRIPEQYRNWFKKSFQVILLASESPAHETVSPKSRHLPKGVGCDQSGRSDISQRAEELLFQTKKASK